jgi:hypothetical protein
MEPREVIAQLLWDPSPSPRIISYSIYLLDEQSNKWTQIGVVIPPDTFFDVTYDGSPKTWGVAAFDGTFESDLSTVSAPLRPEGVTNLRLIARP